MTATVRLALGVLGLLAALALGARLGVRLWELGARATHDAVRATTTETAR